MGIFSGLNIGGSALTAQRLRMDVISNNIANAETTRTAEGGPFKRQEVVFTPISTSRAVPASLRGQSGSVDQGVQVLQVVEDTAPPRMVYDPGHPDADTNGYVAYPDVDIVTEMTDLMSATRAYEANVTAINAVKNMATKALDLLKG